ncbi:MAG TPA: hypothetical protein VK858_02000 [Longimicrobiales bacterium]|nr:hypothetical protein [Longimicrobiales bacterium]
MRTLFAWGRIPAGDRRPLRPPPPRPVGLSGVPGVPVARPTPRDETEGPQLALALSRDASPSEGAGGLREIRFPGGGPAPLPGPWRLRAMVSGSTRA